MIQQLLNHLFTQSRIPKELLLSAIYEYIDSYKGLRKVAWKYGLTHQALWYWVGRFRKAREELHTAVAQRGGVPDVIVVDETAIQTTQGTVWLWFALDPYDKTLLGFSITKGRSALECLLTFRYWFTCWQSKPRVVLTDGGWWYTVLERLGVVWVILSGGLRSYIERFNRTLKEYRWLHYHVHCTCALPAVFGSSHLSGFLTLFMFYYNFLRPHQTLNHPPLTYAFPRRWSKI